MTMLLTVAVLRPVFSFTLAYFVGMGLIGTWIAIVIDQSVRLALLFKRFSDRKWINIKV